MKIGQVRINVLISIRLPILMVIFCCMNSILHAQETKPNYVQISCEFGTCIIKLYDQTPLHRDNFLKLVRARYFDSTTFNRIISHFVVQGGDTDSLYANNKKLRKEQKWLRPEFDDSLFHKKGAVAMGRDDNPSKSSFTTQFYFVQGKLWTDEELDQVQKKYPDGRIIPKYQRAVYKTVGGLPYLDHNYTVFGEVVKGQDLIDKLSAIKVNKEGNPEKEVHMKIRVISFPKNQN